jgi:hypothetical protein
MKTLLAAAALSLAAMSAQASTVFQSLPDLTVTPVQAGYCSSCNPFLQFRIYDTFTLAADTTIKGVTFAMDTRFYQGNSVDLGFFNLNGALPGTAIADSVVQAANFSFADTAVDFIKLVTVDITPVALAAGTYDISFFNANGLSIPAYAKTGGVLYQSGNFFQASQFYPDRSAAFSLDGTVAGGGAPEPGVWAMMLVGLGLAGVSLRSRRLVRAVA